MTPRPADGPPGRTRWCLESSVEGASQLRRVLVYPLPFRVGRGGPVSLPLGAESVSKRHAELFARGEALWVRDLKSRNGTFVNGERVSESALREGDILHFADVEFRLGREELAQAQDEALEPATVSIDAFSLPQQFVGGARELPQLIRERQVTAVFQAIVGLPSGTLAGYEALGRGTHPLLPEAPLELLHVAEAIGAEAELSRLFRERAVEIVEARPRFPLLFLNVHAAELAGEGLASSVLAMRKKRPDLRLALELREEVLDDLRAVDQLRSAIGRAGVGLVYDGFGASQARLLELAEVPPHYLKFDSRFVRGIDAAPQRQRLLDSLLAIARDLLVFTVAQGVETAEEAETCRRLGFSHAQGFFFGKPKPIDQL